MPFHRWLYWLFRKHLACRLGFHGHKFGPDGQPANFCQWGCGHVFNPDACRTWVVTLRTGEQFEVRAINEYHAGSQVVYGPGVGQIDGQTGRALGQIKVHRNNILSALPKQ